MQVSSPRLAFYGDDFTGATDTLATLAGAGQNALLFLRVPDDAQLASAGALDCVGIAGAARSMSAAEQQSEMTSIGAFMARLGAAVNHYKVCSTFDSSPDIGSIGRAVGILRDRLQANFLPFVGGQPNLGRYCVFGHLFAAFQTGGPVFRLDRHPTMSRHPVTPMREADLRLHLAQQGLPGMESVAYTHYDLPADELDALVDSCIEAAPDGVLFDVGHASHLPVIGRQIWLRAGQGPVLAVGASSVAQALLAHWNASDDPSVASPNAYADSPAEPAAISGPVFVLSGSMSPVTARQIDAAVSYERIAIDVDALVSDQLTVLEPLLARISDSLARGRHVLAYTARGETGERQHGIAPATLARACGHFLARVLQQSEVGRVGVAGGDTSSYAMQALDIWGLSYLRQIEPGIALCRTHADNAALAGVEIMLKGGQMGSDLAFEHLIAP